MDRKVENKQGHWRKILIGSLAALAVILVAFFLLDSQEGKSLRIQESRVTVSEVFKGKFEDFIPIRSRVTPLKTVFLDAIEGGRVERILVEDGTLLKKGDLIVELSNTTLQLEVTRNEAAVIEQLNNMRTIELQLEQNRLSHKRNLVEIDYQIKRLTRRVDRERELIKTNNISQAQLDQTEDELAYYINRRNVTLESQATDARMQDAQLVFLQKSSERLEQNLEFSKKNLEALQVRAPVDGKLSGFNAEVGQSISHGGRLGQVDSPNAYKLTANIDEFYLNRVDLGQTAQFSRDGNEYEIRIVKVYPQVKNGQFEADFVFNGEQPHAIRRGQTLQANLVLGDPETAILIPNGAFYQDTGGKWIFVVTPDKQKAVKRPVRLGRRNAQHIEVLEGLEVGEHVVTSPYTGFVEMTHLKLGGVE
ncbi:efflux RND transporter periplasmic adaptor subunit [Kordiimonas pumila]|uniref:Efflux RND transporter periplasmic adaptor subunit n=2 Tax=Kordiimonas pumila TaxID=2161677 RepID=A0ABV7D4N4_9PROT